MPTPLRPAFRRAPVLPPGQGQVRRRRGGLPGRAHHLRHRGLCAGQAGRAGAPAPGGAAGRPGADGQGVRRQDHLRHRLPAPHPGQVRPGRRAPTCRHALMPHSPASGKAERNKYVDTLKAVAKLRRRDPFAFLWVEAGAQSEMEKALDLTFGFPAVIAVRRRSAADPCVRRAAHLPPPVHALRSPSPRAAPPSTAAPSPTRAFPPSSPVS